jgi:hypothetical protein
MVQLNLDLPPELLERICATAKARGFDSPQGFILDSVEAALSEIDPDHAGIDAALAAVEHEQAIPMTDEMWAQLRRRAAGQ